MRAVKPLGHLHTFDFHEQRAQQARDEFKAHGLQDYVTVHHRDVCELGFTAELDGKADAVFLDLPSPHTAVPHALRALKTSGMLSFPNVLQIQTDQRMSVACDFDSCFFELAAWQLAAFGKRVVYQSISVSIGVVRFDIKPSPSLITSASTNRDLVTHASRRRRQIN